MKKTIEIILITIAILFWIFAPLLIVLLPEIKTSYKDIVLNWSDVGEILDKFVQIMSAALIPILIFYFGRQDANRKDLELKIRQQTEELRKFIDEHLIPEVKKCKVYENPTEDIINAFNRNVGQSFRLLVLNSKGLFYYDGIYSVFNKVGLKVDISRNPKNYSPSVKKIYCVIFNIISENLYSALTNEIALKKLINQIDNYINDLEKILTPEEIEQLTGKYNELHRREQEKSE